MTAKEPDIMQLLKDGKYRFKRKINEKLPTLHEKRIKRRLEQDEKKKENLIAKQRVVRNAPRQKVDLQKLDRKKTEVIFMKKADYLIEREELNEDDLDFIVSQIEREAGKEVEVETVKQYL
jgi:hypothetical protein